MEGSIPAHAGEPKTSEATTKPTSVYPRTCGGTIRSAVRIMTCQGLSPHMRGNLSGLPRPNNRGWSIPAHAGEPSQSSSAPIT